MMDCKLDLTPIVEADFGFIKEVYDYYILNSTATFRTSLSTIDELKKDILVDHPIYSSYIITTDSDNVGYCYISQYKNREAYDRTAEISIYLRHDATQKGLGKKVVMQLESIAARNGIKVLLAIITEENRGSVVLFEKCGYTKCAHFKQVGEKFGRILDVVAYQKML